MICTDKPEDLEEQALELERQAATIDRIASRRSDESTRLLAEAKTLKDAAAVLRKRRTDGVRFG
jgi:hypothetical protein